MRTLTLSSGYAIMKQQSGRGISRGHRSVSKALLKTGTVVLALILALGWAWTDVLKQQRYIDDKGRLTVLLVLTGLLALQQIYLVLPKPVSIGVVDKHKTIVESQLTEFLEKYYEILDRTKPKRKAYPIVRVNVMLPTRRWRGLFGTYLKIHYFRCPDTVIYSGPEFSLQWGKGEGTCGTAWGVRKPSVFDSATPELRLPARSLPKDKAAIVRSIKCTLSVPICLDDWVVGVLNLDSKQNIRDTLFLDNDVIVLAGACANALSGQFFEDGVEG
jgi:hypothetical protein